jgi:hypothetical protein
VDNGVYTIRLEARDKANNKDAGSTDIITITVDNPVAVVFAGGVLGASTDVPNNVGEEKEQNNGEVLAVSTENTDTTTDETSGEVLADTDTLATTGNPAYLQIAVGLAIVAAPTALYVNRRKFSLKK